MLKRPFNVYIFVRKTDIKLDVHESVHRDIITKTTNEMQLCRLIYYSLLALHVSGDVFAHHQEHLSVLLMMGENRPKHIEPIRNNKLTYVVASYWLFS
jgi:hypothetical protein